MSPPLLVIGGRGLLGSAVVRAARLDGREVRTVVVPWADEHAAPAALVEATAKLAQDSDGGPWQVAWCAGAGVVGASEAQVAAELATLQRYLDALPTVLGSTATAGAFFLASSAGGIYAGVPGGHYDESSPVAPLAPYGRAKLSAESLVADVSARSGLPTLVGRIANLYGPGQSLLKAQGVISQICRAHVVHEPSHIYVSLDTVRDYLFVDDAASLVLDGLDELSALGARRRPGPTPHVVKILCSHRPVTLAAVLAECRRVFKQTPHVVLGASPASANQVRSLRFTSQVWPHLDRRSLTPLPVGIHRTLLDLRQRSAAR